MKDYSALVTLCLAVICRYGSTEGVPAFKAMDMLRNRSPLTDAEVQNLTKTARPGIDYPVMKTIPKNLTFSCSQIHQPGYYVNLEPQSRCQIYHRCELDLPLYTYLCPEGKLFNQITLNCDWWFNVQCEKPPAGDCVIMATVQPTYRHPEKTVLRSKEDLHFASVKSMEYYDYSNPRIYMGPNVKFLDSGNITQTASPLEPGFMPFPDAANAVTDPWNGAPTTFFPVTAPVTSPPAPTVPPGRNVFRFPVARRRSHHISRSQNQLSPSVAKDTFVDPSVNFVQNQQSGSSNTPMMNNAVEDNRLVPRNLPARPTSVGGMNGDFRNNAGPIEGNADISPRFNQEFLSNTLNRRNENLPQREISVKKVIPSWKSDLSTVPTTFIPTPGIQPGFPQPSINLQPVDFDSQQLPPWPGFPTTTSLPHLGNLLMPPGTWNRPPHNVEQPVIKAQKWEEPLDIDSAPVPQNSDFDKNARVPSMSLAKPGPLNVNGLSPDRGGPFGLMANQRSPVPPSFNNADFWPSNNSSALQPVNARSQLQFSPNSGFSQPVDSWPRFRLPENPKGQDIVDFAAPSLKDKTSDIFDSKPELSSNTDYLFADDDGVKRRASDNTLSSDPMIKLTFVHSEQPGQGTFYQ